MNQLKTERQILVNKIASIVMSFNDSENEIEDLMYFLDDAITLKLFKLTTPESKEKYTEEQFEVLMFNLNNLRDLMRAKLKLSNFDNNLTDDELLSLLTK